MDNKNDLSLLSVKLYHYLSDYVVGSAKVVKYRRYFYKCFDDYLNHEHDEESRIISSGSKAEGLDLPGSDLDLMTPSYHHMVDETHGKTKKKHLILDTNNALPGFALIKVSDESDFQVEKIYVTQTLNGLLLNNDFLKQRQFQKIKQQIPTFFMRDTISTLSPLSLLGVDSFLKIQGPSVSSALTGIPDADNVFCIPCREWPSIAKHWIHRNRCCQWPSSDLMTEAIYEGVLLVPVGSKSPSTDENNFEWRFSFSLTEKLLVHSFNHSQLLCYALLKLFLKGIIDKENIFNKLLCSYYMKTVLFWVLEEIKHSYWTPKNLLRCFSLCLQRLHYFISCNYIPNYFIPEHNMIESRFSEEIRLQLGVFIENLLKCDVWEVLLSLDVLSDLRHTTCYVSKPSHGISEFDKTMITMNIPDCVQFNENRSLRFLLHRIRHESCPTFFKNIYAIALLDLCKSKATSIEMHSVDSQHIINKQYYSQYKQCLFYLLLNLNGDAVSGWLLLTAFYYSCQEYRKMNVILQLSEEILSRDLYALSHWWDSSASRITKFEKENNFSRHFLKRLRHSLIKIVFVKKDVETDDSFIFHEDLAIDNRYFATGTPIVFVRYLRFLYFYKQNNTEGMKRAFLLLQEVVESSPELGVFCISTNFIRLFNTQSLMGIDVIDDCKTLDRMFTVLKSLDVTGLFAVVEKECKLYMSDLEE
ncbi:Hypothetical predicted protein [Mytilus galloprovincialis]|uniref:Mab-21-like HhH/H2TH-like domain-containing protein n=1 Tax=Mytilus galloprovincialis TaxID=29158 RepID=A0A8B6CZ00_MYTGA|nr:Hypothetical predicted protein [Mytilus galloprovincialis]